MRDHTMSILQEINKAACSTNLSILRAILTPSTAAVPLWPRSSTQQLVDPNTTTDRLFAALLPLFLCCCSLCLAA
jgi:hypothetical protein